MIAPASVLLVDDRPENLLALEGVLEPLGLRLVRARSSAEALRQVLRASFAVILLDVRMPGTDGLETARLIKRRASSQHIPIILLTALERDDAHAWRGYESGAVDFLFRPVDPSLLRAKVSAFVELDRQRVRLTERSSRRAADRAMFESQSRNQAVAEEATRLKSEFLTTMSHEFRTPLNAILGYAELLALGVPDVPTLGQRRHLERLQASARHLLGLVEDVLDVAKVNADRLSVRHDVLDLGAAMAAALAVVRAQAEAKGVRVNEPDDSADAAARRVRYVGDEHRVRQVLVHLLTNAIKFTPPGGHVTLSCGTSDAPEPPIDAPAGPWAFARVADTGSGVPAALLARIFEPFVQGDGTLTRAQGGTGLGLAISRGLARRMGGELAVHSEPGRGAAFTLSLPGPIA